MKYFVVLTALSGLFIASCATHHEIETKSKVELAPVEVKPIHIIVDINVKIQEELKKEFSEEDKINKTISEREAEEALKKYLESKNNKETK